MDKRTKRGCGKCFCWTICLIILIAVVVIGTLAGTGVILNNEVQPVSGESNKPRFFNGGALEVTTMANDKQQLETSTLDSNSNIPFFTPGPPISTVSSMLPTTETSMIQVPRALEGQIIIDNEEFTPGLGIHNSTEFKNLATKLEKQIKDALFDQFSQQYGAADINIKVTDFMPGSIVVKYRVGWEFKNGFYNTQDPLDVETLKTKLEDHLNQNSGYIDNFHISKETVTANKVLDMCQIDKNGCEYNCTFDYVHMDFMCVCPEGQILNEDGKTCKMATEPDMDYPPHFDYEYEDKMVHATTSEPHAEPEPAVTETHRHSHIFDTESEKEHHFVTTTKVSDEESNTRRVITPETVISSETTMPPKHHNYNENMDEITTHNVYKDLVHIEHVDEFGKDTTTPATHADYTNYEMNTHNEHNVHIIEEEGASTTAKIFTFEHEPSSEPTPDIEPVQNGNDTGSIGTGRGFNIFIPVTTTVEPDSAAEPTSEPEPSSTGEHHIHDEHDHDSSDHHDTNATTEFIPAAEPEPTAEPNLDSNSETTSVHEPDTTSEPISAAEPTSSFEPNSVPEPDSSAEPISIDEPVSTAEPPSISEVKSTTVSVAESEFTQKNISLDEVDSNIRQNSASEPEVTPEPNSVTEPETTAEPTSVDEPITTAEPNPSVEHDSTSQTNNIVSISTSDSYSAVELDTTTTPAPVPTNESDSTQLSHSSTEQNTIEHSSTIELVEQNHTTDEFNLVSESATTTQSMPLDTRKLFTSGSETEPNQTNQTSIPTETTTMSSRDNRLLNMDSIDESTLNGTVHSYSVHEDVVDTTPAPPLIYTVGTETGQNNTETTGFPSHEHHIEENNVSGNEDTIEPITNEVITYKPDEHDNSIHEITSEENPNVTLDIQSNFETVTAIPHYITQLSSTTEQQNIDKMVTTISTTDNLMNEDVNGLIHENQLNGNHEITTHTISTTLRPSNRHSYEVYEANVESDPAEVTTNSPDQSIVTTEMTHLPDLHTGTEVPNLVDHKQETSTPNISTSSQSINVSEMNEMTSTKEMFETSTTALPMMNEAHDENDALLSVVPLEKQNKTAETYNTSDFLTETKENEDDHKTTTTTSPTEQINTNVEEITTHSTLVKEVPVFINSAQTSIEVTSSLNTVHDTETSKPLFIEKGRRLEDFSGQLVSVNINKENEYIPTTIQILSTSTEVPTTSKALESETITPESEVIKNTTDTIKTEEDNLETTDSVQNNFESEQTTRTTTPMIMKDQTLGVSAVTTEIVRENMSVQKSNLTENSIFDTPATKPPRLDNDEKNETNPIELNPPVNSTLTVIPLSEISSENSNEINVSTTDKFANNLLSTEKVVETTEATSVTTASTNFSNTLEVHASEKQNIDTENTETVQSVTTTPSPVLNNSIVVNENTVFTTGNGENLVHTITEKVQPVTVMDEATENNTTILPPRENMETTMNPVMTTTSSIPVIHGETVYTATETVVVQPEHFEPNTDYNDLLASSTENTDKVLQTKVQSENNSPTVEPETTTMNPVILREITSEKVTTVTKSVSAVINTTNHSEDLNSISDIVEEKPVNVFENENDNDSLLSVVPLQKHTNEKKKTDVEKKLSKVYNKELQYEKNSKNDIDDLNKFEEDFVLDKFSRSSSSRAPEQNLTSENMQEGLSEITNNTFHSEEMVARNMSFDSVDNAPSEENQTENVIANKKTEDDESVLSKVDKFRNFSKCASGQFQCTNGTSVKDGSYCIARSARCDSINDCSDGSDEVGCAEENCLDNFQCKSGQCLKRHLVCNGITNCDDASDELDCGSWECRFDEFSCGTGNKCIPLTWRCDGLAHCPDASDERACLHAHCGNQEYHCIEQDTCIPLSWRCDGKPDCMAGQDEKLCECSLEQFKCESGGCVSENQRCDGIDDCPDRSDEWNCVKIESIHDDNQTVVAVDNDRSSNSSKMFLQILSSKNKWYYVCSDNWNQTYSDITCQNLGYANSVYTEHTYSKSIKTDGGFLKLKEPSNRNSKLLSMLEYVDYCDNVVSIACQEFICGNAVVSDTGSIQSQWPSVTLLYNKRRNTQCTASLITPSWVLVSYACIHSDMEPRNWILYAGGTHLDVLLNSSNAQVSEVKSIVPHPQAKYMQFLFKNDAALIELTKPVNLAMDMNPVCIPEQNIDSRQVCVTAGWGINKPGESNLRQYLQYLPVPTIETDECNSTKHYNGYLDNDQICAGFIESEKSATCYNDEGAPLMCFNDNENAWELQGILSYHGNCGRKQHPAIYTAISADLKRWIANTVGDIAIIHKRKMFNV